jgi:hypothetical protein
MLRAAIRTMALALPLAAAPMAVNWPGAVWAQPAQERQSPPRPPAKPAARPAERPAPANPAPANPAAANSAAASTAATLPGAEAGVRLRSGLIEDNPAEPDFPTITQGAVTWASARPAGEGPEGPRIVTARAEFTRGASRISLDLAIAVSGSGLRTTLSGTLTGLPGAELTDMPAARRSAATEGEPLAGRIAAAAAASFEVELSQDERDVPNNWRRLTQPAWLDLRFRLGDGRSLVLTLEKARAGNELLLALTPPAR